MFTFCRIAAVMLAATAAWVPYAAHAQTVVPPLPTTGPYPVACTNVEQDFSRVPSGETAEMYWRGSSGGGKERYVDALLVSPANALTSTVHRARATSTSTTAGPASRSPMSSSRATRPRRRTRAPITRCPAATSIPKMQRGNEAPILPASPVAVAGAALLARLRRQPAGRQLPACADRVRVVGIRHRRAVPRRSALLGVRSRLGRLRRRRRYVPIWSEFVAMQAIRPLSLSAGSTFCSRARSGAIASTPAASARSASARAARR